MGKVARWKRIRGDVLPGFESRSIVWAGKKIAYVVWDTVSGSFQYEIRLGEVVAAVLNGMAGPKGPVQLEEPLQEVYGDEPFLLPKGNTGIRIELYRELFDIRTARHWMPKELSQAHFSGMSRP